MSLLQLGNYIEIERQNNKALGSRVDEAIASLVQAGDIRLEQMEKAVEHQRTDNETMRRLRTSLIQEFADRDAALAALIGDGE
jgi:CO/xanthine dehydrogenase FAD-binding subunit